MKTEHETKTIIAIAHQILKSIYQWLICWAVVLLLHRKKVDIEIHHNNML